MRQHPIDLMPPVIRSRTLAGMRAGRFIAASVATMLALVVIATHSRVSLSAAQERLATTKAQSEAVLAIDAKAAEFRRTLDRTQSFVDLYEKVAFPIQVSAVMATVINALPKSVTLDQIDLTAGARAGKNSPRSKSNEAKGRPVARLLNCELSGFAASDEHIAQLVSVLENTAPFRNVNLDFSRTKQVRDRDAREFRLSFNIDLNQTYQMSPLATSGVED